jgi:hypothetical protein
LISDLVDECHLRTALDGYLQAKLALERWEEQQLGLGIILLPDPSEGRPAVPRPMPIELRPRPTDHRAPPSHPAAPPPGRPSPLIRCFGNRNYQLGDTPPVCVTDAEDNVFQAARLLHGRAFDEEQLKATAGGDDPARVLRRLCHSYGGRFAAAIHLPGRKGKGGYRVDIEPTESAPKEGKS